MFKIGEYIIYGVNGVCKVEAVGPMDIAGMESDKDFYTLVPLYTRGSKVYTPVDNEKVVMRRVVDKQEACELIDEMESIKEMEEICDKNRELAYKEAMKSCDCRQWIQVVNTILKRKEDRLSKGKKMSACDERYLKSALDNLYGEFAISLNIEKGEVQNYIEHRRVMKEMASAS